MEDELHHIRTTGFPGAEVTASNVGGVGNLCSNEQVLSPLTTSTDISINEFRPGMPQQTSQRLYQIQRIPPYYGDDISGAQFPPSADNGNLDTNKWMPNGNSNVNLNANVNGGGAGAGHHTEFNGNNAKTDFTAISLNNSHTMNDPSIHESLSPFFQPFGIDVNHLPLTNPPIFQSSLTSIDEPFKRRRISISNGQINQLSEDLETLENLYNTQPPPLPQRFDHQQVHTTQLQQSNLGRNLVRQQIKLQPSEGGISSAMGLQGQVQSRPNGASMSKPSIDTSDSQGDMQRAASTPAWANKSGDNDSQADDVSNDPASQNITFDRHSASSERSSVSSISSHTNRISEPMPGTNAWKRARLLERNRMAASKCRQRKKVAQLQLQKDFDLLSKENKTMRKKLEYYEKLVTKFKRFSEAHLRKCSGSDESLEIIEEMLMIDSGIKEVDDSGLVVKLEDRWH